MLFEYEQIFTTTPTFAKWRLFPIDDFGLWATRCPDSSPKIPWIIIFISLSMSIFVSLPMSQIIYRDRCWYWYYYRYWYSYFHMELHIFWVLLTIFVRGSYSLRFSVCAPLGRPSLAQGMQQYSAWVALQNLKNTDDTLNPIQSFVSNICLCLLTILIRLGILDWILNHFTLPTAIMWFLWFCQLSWLVDFSVKRFVDYWHVDA